MPTRLCSWSGPARPLEPESVASRTSPGRSFKDPGDGQRAAIWRMRARNGERLSFDVGRYGSVTEFRAVVAETIETRGVWGLGADALADIDDPGDDDDECDDPLAYCPPRPGGGGGDDPWGEPSTFLTRVLLTQQLDVNGDNELFLELFFRHGHFLSSGRWENYDVIWRKEYELNDLIHTESPIFGGVIFRLRAWEEDPWPNADEDLGEQVLGVQDNGHIKYFFHEDSLALEATLEWDDGTGVVEEDPT